MFPALRLALVVTALLAPISACGAETKTTLSNLSSVGRTVLLDNNGHLKTNDLSWLLWRFDRSQARRADWRALKDWLALRQHETTDAMRAKLAALDANLDLAHLPVKCFDDLLCSDIDDAVTRSEAIDSRDRLAKALAEAEPVYRTFLKLDAISRRSDKRKLDDLDGSLRANLLSRAMRDQGLMDANRDLDEQMSPDGKIILDLLLNVTYAEAVFDNADFMGDPVNKERWPTASQVGKRNAIYAWLMVQHADEAPDLQLRTLSLMQPLLDSGEAEPWTYAYLFDRVNVNLGLPQLYGSQFHCVNGHLELQPLAQPGDVDILRKAKGLGPLANYSISSTGKCTGGVSVR